MNVTLESLKATHGKEAEKVFAEIAELGGWGKLESEIPGGVSLEASLDLTDVLDKGNKAVSSENRGRIEELTKPAKAEKDKPAKAENSKEGDK